MPHWKRCRIGTRPVVSCVLIDGESSNYFYFLSVQVFGNYAYHVILKGSVNVLSEPYINLPGTIVRPITPEPSRPIEVRAGCVCDIWTSFDFLL
jgi:hypothetical protein